MTESRADQTDDLVELERARIGHEIHDALLPLIFAASSGVQMAIRQLPAEAEQAREKLAQSAQWLDDALLTGRQLLTEIYPPELTGSLWVRAAKDALDRLFPETTAQVSWNVDDAAQQVSSEVAVAAYRIVVEAVRNAIRHGQANQIQVAAARQQRTIEIVIRDDGCGFDPRQTQQNRYGLRAMAGRAASVGGSLQVTSQVGGPTVVSFTAPHSAEAKPG